MALTLRGADVLILVQDGHSSEPYVRAMGSWLDSHRPGKYSIDYSPDVSPNVLDSSDSLSSDQMDLLESYDLIIMPRHGPGGSSNFASNDWNDVTTPMLIQNPFTVRDQNWRWIPEGTGTGTDNLWDLVVVDEGSPLFDGIDVSEGETIRMTYLPEGHMQVELESDLLTGDALAWTPRFDEDTEENLEYPWIVHWDGTEEAYYDDGPEAPGGPRMLFLEQLRSNKEEYRRDAQQLWINAVSMMATGQSDPGNLLDEPVGDEPDAPVSGASILLLTDVEDEDAGVHVALADALANYFPGSNVSRSAAFVTDGDPLSEAQLADLAGYDLIVMPRAVSVGPYNTLTWNDVPTPILNLHPDYQRRSVELEGGGMSEGWSWFSSTSAGEQEDLMTMTVRNWVSSPEGFPHPFHTIYSGIAIPADAVIQMYEEPVDTRRVNTSTHDPNRIFGDFLGSVEQQAIRSFISLWRGGESFGSWVDDGDERFLPIPASARAQFLMPGEEGHVDDLTDDGAQILLNIANWLIEQGRVTYYVAENFERYKIDPDFNSAVLPNISPNLWEVPTGAWDAVPDVIRGYHPGGDSANAIHFEVAGNGWEPASMWRLISNGPGAGEVDGPVDWSFYIRLDDATLSSVNMNLALGEDTGEADIADNMREGNAGAIRIIQNGTDNKLGYVGGDGMTTAIENAHANVWYRVSMSLDMDEQTYALDISTLEGSQSFSVEDVPFIGAVDRLDYIALFSESSDSPVALSLNDIVVSAAVPEVEPAGFAEWRAQHFPDDPDNDSVSGPGADPDGDGIPNALEYVLGGNPNVPDRSRAPEFDTVEIAGEDYLQIEFLRDPDAAGVVVSVERSAGLSDWDPIAGPEDSVPENGLVRETWVDDQPIGGDSRGVLRVNVELTD